MQYYSDVQEANEQRKKRLLAYHDYIDNKTKSKMTELIHELIACRKKKGLTQQDIADATGIAAPNIARLESCRRIPTLQVLEKYSEAVGMRIDFKLVPDVGDDVTE